MLILCQSCVLIAHSGSSFKKSANSSQTLVGGIDQLGGTVAELVKSCSLEQAIYNMDQKGILVSSSEKTMGSTSSKDGLRN